VLPTLLRRSLLPANNHQKASGGVTPVYQAFKNIKELAVVIE